MFPLFSLLGRRTISFFHHLGRLVILMFRMVLSLGELWGYRKLVVDQMMAIGVRSLAIVMYLSVFAGMVTSVQAAYQMESYIPKYLIGSVVGKSMMLELSAVLTALVLTGRVGATIAAETGTMRVTEQIDALEVMGFNAVAYLIVPRVVAGMVMFPVLSIFSNAVGITGGWLVSIASIGLTSEQFMKGIRMYFVPFDIIYGLIKGACFGLTVTLIGCYYGYYAEGGARGVGLATTSATVTSCLLILTLDYTLAQVLL